MFGNKSGTRLLLASLDGSPPRTAGVSPPRLNKVVLTLFVLCVLIWNAHAGCSGSCGACARRYGCMTPAWGKCCTQFFMHNGRKRSDPSARPDDVIESIIEYIRLKSKVIHDRKELVDNISDQPDLGMPLSDDVMRGIPMQRDLMAGDDVRDSLDDAMTYNSLRDDGINNRMEEYKHRR